MTPKIHREIFITQRLSNGDEVTMLKALGTDVYSANRAAKDDLYNFAFYFLCEITKVNGAKVDLTYLRTLPVDDLLLLFDVVDSQTAKINFKK